MLDNLKKFKKVYVKQLVHLNQFVMMSCDTEDGNVYNQVFAFQSYQSLIAVYDFNDDILYINYEKWDYSKTTIKHLKMFINEYTPFRYENRHQFMSVIVNDERVHSFKE